MNEYTSEDASRILRRLEISEEAVRAHVFKPDSLKEVATGVEGFHPGLVDYTPPSGFFYRLNVEKFGRDLHALLSTCVVGYSMKLRRRGRTVLTRQWRWSKTPDDGSVAWTASVPMHVASVSKLITAMAMTRLLGERGLSPDARIASWLPAYWPLGHHADRITFRHLLTHTSGLNFEQPLTPSDFPFMKSQIAQGTTHLGQRSYQNMNYGLCRILICTLAGTLPRTATFSMFGLNLTDAFWDIVSINSYAQYVRDNVFAPAGVSAPTLDHPDEDALAYSFPVVGKGWSAGDLSTMCGGVGWHISTDELLSVMGTFRRGSAIVSPSTAEAMLENDFGVDVRKDTLLGRMYAKGGFWGDGTHFEQSNAYFLPRNMELVILANSPFCAADRGFLDQVTTVIEDNIEFNLSTIVAGAVGVLGGLLAIGIRARARRRRP